MIRMVASTGSVMLTLPAAPGPTTSLRRYVSGACMSPPGSDAASTVMLFGAPLATRLVPSSGSTAMSIMTAASGFPTCSPMNSIGASSRSPSPMTMVPLRSASSIAWRMASTAARSAPWRSPRPIWRAAASAAASVAAMASSVISLCRSGAFGSSVIGQSVSVSAGSAGGR